MSTFDEDVSRSRAVDLIRRTLTFTDWSRCPDDEIERVAVRLLDEIEKRVTA